MPKALLPFVGDGSSTTRTLRCVIACIWCLPVVRAVLTIQPSEVNQSFTVGSEVTTLQLDLSTSLVGETQELSFTLELSSTSRRLAETGGHEEVEDGDVARQRPALPSSEEEGRHGMAARVRRPRAVVHNWLPKAHPSRTGRWLFGWRSSRDSPAHGRRLRALRGILAQEGAKVRLLHSAALGVLHKGGMRTLLRLRRAMPGVIDFIEPDTTVEKAWNDPLESVQWALTDIKATEAESQTKAVLDAGGAAEDVVVAVLDTGCNLNHEDLSGQFWQNAGEIAGNNIDDDGNGFIDDKNGWNFANDDTDPTDEDGHGSHVAGIINAAGDNSKGMVGVSATSSTASKIKVMPLKVLTSSGGSISDVTAGVTYAMDNGADVISMSFGTSSYSISLRRALSKASSKGIQLVAAAGNDGKNLDDNKYYPCSFSLTLLTCVAATKRDGALATFSNYGEDTVHLAAPGSGITSTVLENNYASYSGTSMACPYVSGSLAVILAVFPYLPSAYVRDLVLDNVRSGSLKVKTGGRLELDAAITKARQQWVVVELPGAIGGNASSTQKVNLTLGRSGSGLTSGLTEGVYTARLKISAVGTSTETVEVPVTLRVQGIPDLQTQQGSINFGQVPLGMQSVQTFELSNVGNGTSYVTSTVEGEFDDVQPANFELKPGESISVSVTCAPQNLGPLSGKVVLTYTWDSGDEWVSASVDLPLQATAVIPPELAVEAWSGLLVTSPEQRELASTQAEWNRLVVQDSAQVLEIFAIQEGNGQACEALQSSSGLVGRIGLVRMGGGDNCRYWDQMQNIRAAGGLAMIVHDVANQDEDGEELAYMSTPSGVDGPVIPSYLVSGSDGEALRSDLTGSAVEVELRNRLIISHVRANGGGSIQVQIENHGGMDISYTAGATIDNFAAVSDYQALIGEDRDGEPLPLTWYSLPDSAEIEYFQAQDDASIWLKFPSLFPFFGQLVSGCYLYTNGFLVCEPDHVAGTSFVRGTLDVSEGPYGVIAPFWENLRCGDFCRISAGKVTATDGSADDWYQVIQFEDAEIAGMQDETLTFQLLLVHDGTIKILFQKWPSSSAMKDTLVGVKPFSGAGSWQSLQLDNLPWSGTSPFAVELIPWMVPQHSNSTSGVLAAGGSAMLVYSGRAVTGDKEGWISIKGENAIAAYHVSRDVKVVLQTAVRFAVRAERLEARCGNTVSIEVVAESLAGEVASTEERDVVLLYSNSSNVVGEVVVPITKGRANVTLSHTRAEDWELTLEDRFSTGLAVAGAKATLQWLSADPVRAAIEVPQDQVTGKAFSVTVVFYDTYENVVPETLVPLGDVESLWLDYQGAGSPSSVGLGGRRFTVQLSFDQQQVVFSLRDSDGTSPISLGAQVTVEVHPYTHEYWFGNWSDCDAACGTGTRTREVQCQPLNSDVNVSDSNCVGLQRPADEESCEVSCLRGTCINGERCECFLGFSGTLCDAFDGCPEGYTEVPSAGAAIPEQCQGILCSTPVPGGTDIDTAVSNGGRYPSNATFTCRRGLTLNGESYASCTTSGAWEVDGDSPWCAGPSELDKECQMGSSCTLSLSGVGLAESNGLWLFRDTRSCPRSRIGGIRWDQAQLLSGTQQSFTWHPVASASVYGGLTAASYISCWVEDAGLASGTFVQVGSLTVSGPRPSNLACKLGVPCVVQLSGLSLSSDDNKMWIESSSACMGNSSVRVRYDGWQRDEARLNPAGEAQLDLSAQFGTASGGTVGVPHSICWSHGGDSDGVSIGQFLMYGPMEVEGHHCIFWSGTCQVTVDGFGLLQRDELTIKAAAYDSGTCTGSPVTENIVADFVLSQGDRETAIFEFGTIKEPQQTTDPADLRFWVCWQTVAVPGGSEPLPLNIGEVRLLGPYLQTQSSCALGSSCVVPVIGTGFSGRDQVTMKLHNAGSPCSTSTADVTIHSGGSAPSIGFSDEDQGDDERVRTRPYQLGYLAGGHPGLFTVCFAMQQAGRAEVPVGTVEVKGPYMTTYRCNWGEPCSIQMGGIGLTNEAEVTFRLDGRFEEGCQEPRAGVGAAGHMPLGTFEGTFGVDSVQGDDILINPGTPVKGPLSRKLRVCWREKPESDFVQTGMVEVIMPGGYLTTAAAQGRKVMHFVTTNARIRGTFDISDPVHRSAVKRALLDYLPEIEATDLALMYPPDGYVSQAYPVAIRVNSSADATRLAYKIDNTYTIVESDRILALMRETVEGVYAFSFLETVVDEILYNDTEYEQLFGHIFETADPPQSSGGDDDDNFFGNIWFIFCVAGGGLVLLHSCVLCCLIWLRVRRKRRSPPDLGTFPPDDGVSPSDVSPTTVGRSSRQRAADRTRRRRISVEEQNRAVLQMLEMGYTYDRATEALQETDFDIEAAIERLQGWTEAA